MKCIGRITLVMLLFFAWQINVKAVVVFDSKTDKIYGKNQITKDGITISTTNGDTWKYNEFSGELSITTSNGNIVMVGLKQPDYKYDGVEWSNSYGYDLTSLPSKHKSVQKRNDYSGSWEEWEFILFDNHYFFDVNNLYSIGYRVWKGIDTELICSYGKYEKIFVYLEGDELPQKSTFAMYSMIDLSYPDLFDDSTSCLTICYGYLNFLSEDCSYDYSAWKQNRTINCEVNKYPFYVDGRDQELPYAKNIYFDESFSEFKPESTKKWFKGVSFDDISFYNLNLSEVTDMSYMFENCHLEKLNTFGLSLSNSPIVTGMFSGGSINYLDMSNLSFSNHPNVTGMFLGSSINYFKVNESVGDADDNVFVGLGSDRNPCYLIGSPNNGQVTYINDTTFSWKGGYFYKALNKIYITSSGTYLRGEDYNRFDKISAKRSIEFCYDSLYLEKLLYQKQPNEWWFDDEEYYDFKYIYERWADVCIFDMNGVGWTDHGIEAYYKRNWEDEGYYCLAPSSFPISFNPSFAEVRPKSTKGWFDFSKNTSHDASNSTNFDQAQRQRKKSNYSQDIESRINLLIDGLCYLNTSEVTDMSDMFGCKYFPFYNYVSSLDLSHFNTSKVTDMSSMFMNLIGLTQLDLSNFDTSNVTNMSGMFRCEPIGDWDDELERDIFNYLSTFTSIDIGHFNTSNVTDMSYMFSGCNGLSSLDVSNFNTSNVTDMSNMFRGCSGLTSLNVNNFETSKVTDMSSMFYDCSGLTSLDLKNFNTSKVTNMNWMFSGCSNLTSLDVNNFDISNVTDMSHMFYDCCSLTSLDVSKFETSKVTNMSYLFYNCSGLTSLDVSHFDTSKLGRWNSSDYMFTNCNSLKEIAISATMSNLSNNAFQGVGSINSPCTIYAPIDFDFGTDTDQPYFRWKGGYFVKGTIPVEVGDTITYAGLQYQVTKFGDGDNEVTLIKNPTAEGSTTIPSVITDESGTFSFEVTAIEDYAFFNCANIPSLHIPASVKSIGVAITSCCTILNEITVAENNPYYDSRENCNAIINTQTGELLAGCNKTTIPDGVTAIGTEAMRGMFDLEGITFPKTLTSIGNRAFYYCRCLTGHLNVPEGVTEIATYAFYKCIGLTAISLPSTITTMGTCAFRECSNVTWVSCYADTPPSIDSRMFGKFSGCTLMVPAGSVSTYKNATNWKKFDLIIQESILSVEDVAIAFENKGTAHIALNNGPNVYIGCQFNITLPEGMDLVKTPRGGYDYSTSNRFSGTPSITITPQDDGSYMVLIYSTDNVTINGSEGVILSLPVKVDVSQPIGEYTANITNVTLNNPDNTSAYLRDTDFIIIVPAYMLGDVNYDRSINITDVMLTVNYVVGQTPAGFHEDVADVNNDNVINISDIMGIVNLLISAESANAPAHAREATTDAITIMPTAQGYAVSLKNNEPYTALQMDIQMPSNAAFNARLVDNRSNGHSVTCHDLGNGHHRIAIYSLNGNALKGSDGILLQLLTNTKQGSLPEVSNVQLTNNIFESVTLSNISTPTDITNVDTDSSTDVPTYNTQGIRATKHEKCIIIQDGRKQVQKK